MLETAEGRPVFLLQLFAILPLIMAFVHLFGTCHLVAWGESKLYSRIVLASGFFGMATCAVAVSLYGSHGAIAAILMSYTLVALASFDKVWCLRNA